MKEEEVIAFNKLGYLSEIRLLVKDVTSMKMRLQEEVDLISIEDRCLSEFKREMESLNQEKATHVEELRQIHSDINMLDNVQKQSEEDRNRRVEAVKIQYQQLQSMKSKIDKMCSEIGVSRMFENDNEHQPEILNDKRFKSTSVIPEQFLDHTHNNHPLHLPRISGALSMEPIKSLSNVKPFADNTNTANASGNATNSTSCGVTSSNFSSSIASLMSGFQDKTPYAGRLGLLGSSAGVPGSGTGGQGLSATSSGPNLGSFHNQDSGIPSSLGSSPAFRQQPPPMKACASCHQQIHRNAPICPLCKAKSRSRHPKRRQPKRLG